MDFEELEAAMHEEVDDTLGDVILLKVPPADFVPVKGFVLKSDAPFDPTSTIDPLGQVTRVKLRKELCPAPDRSVRFQSAKLGPGTFMIAGDPDDGASHWLFDIQLAEE